jgi:hypothetical protein
MKKIIITALFLVLGTNTAVANCPSGNCAVEINCTTGVVTYTDAPPRESVAAPVLIKPVAPTHTISVQTTNQSWGTSGTPEQIALAVLSLAPAPISVDPCLNGGCTKIEVNATTGVTTISPLSEIDLKQRAKDQVVNNQQRAELAKNAYQALPNITTWQPSDPFANEPLLNTPLDETLTPEWWVDWFQSFNSYFESWFWWWAS